MMADHFVDIVENGLDLLSRIGNRLDSSMISHRICTTRRVTNDAHQTQENLFNILQRFGKADATGWLGLSLGAMLTEGCVLIP